MFSRFHACSLLMILWVDGFLAASVVELRFIQCILLCFVALFEVRVNLALSAIILVG